jgi:hypothetical protein
VSSGLAPPSLCALPGAQRKAPAATAAGAYFLWIQPLDTALIFS